jgi:hypothetical protein
MAHVTRSTRKKHEEDGEEAEYISPKKTEETIMMKLTSPSAKVSNPDSGNENVDDGRTAVSPSNVSQDLMEKKWTDFKTL